MNDGRFRRGGFDEEREPQPRKGLWERISDYTDGIVTKTRLYVAGGILAAALVGWSSFYVNPPGVKGVVTRFGEHIETTDNGIHGKIPFVDGVIKVNTEEIHTEEFGFRTLHASDGRTGYLDQRTILSGEVSDKEVANFLEGVVDSGEKLPSGNPREQAAQLLQLEYLMLTGDLKIVDVEGSLQWQVSDAAKYAFNVENPSKLVRSLYLQCMRGSNGDGSADEAISSGRENNQTFCKGDVQKILDRYDVGIRVNLIVLQSTQPPMAVKPAYDDVNAAQSDRDRMINDAQKKWNDMVPAKEGERDSAIAKARGYASQTVDEAKGEMFQFWNNYKAFMESPDINRKRMEWDTLQQVLQHSEVNVLDSKGGALPLYDMRGGAK